MKKIFVTEPSLPPLEEFKGLLEQIWENKWLTNNGKFHQEFEQKLCDYYNVKYCSLFSNGTLALIIGLRARRLVGEVITTPYTFVATVHSLYWTGNTPVFCDIQDNGFNIDEDKIESLITPKTVGILPVHVYGNPCNVHKIDDISQKYGLPVIYDAAHSFGVKCKDHNIFDFGDMSILSFHATKVFNTFEGGAILTNDLALKKRFDLLKNFAFEDEVTVKTHGINAKMSEFQAALGVLQLEYIDEEISKREIVFKSYINLLKDVKGIEIVKSDNLERSNYSYFPILVKNNYSISRDKLYEEFKKNEIYARRYFYPLVSEMSPYKNLNSAIGDNLINAKKIAKEIICLPLHANMQTSDLERIVEILKEHGG